MSKLERTVTKEYRLGYNSPMDKTWEVKSDGSYRALSVTEDLVSESQFTMEDIAHTSEVLREMMASCRRVQLESRFLVKQSQRERRLRKSPLRLVKTFA